MCDVKGCDFTFLVMLCFFFMCVFEIIENLDFQLITDILSRNQIPVIVGGTNYYIQV